MQSQAQPETSNFSHSIHCSHLHTFPALYSQLYQLTAFFAIYSNVQPFQQCRANFSHSSHCLSLLAILNHFQPFPAIPAICFKNLYHQFLAILTISSFFQPFQACQATSKNCHPFSDIIAISSHSQPFPAISSYFLSFTAISSYSSYLQPLSAIVSHFWQ